MEELPESVDVVVLGTGLPESIIAAACSRSGLSVLHLDRNNYYGGSWSSFNLKTIDEWATPETTKAAQSSPDDTKIELQQGESFLDLGDRTSFADIEMRWTEESAATTKLTKKGGEEEMITHRAKLEKEWRRFSIDLAPKALLSRGDMVATLCDSEVSKYAEFKLIDRLLFSERTEDGITFSPVPFSKAQIATSKLLSPIEKFQFNRFFKFCLKWHEDKDAKEVESWKENTTTPFIEFLKSSSYSERVATLICDAIGILHPNANTEEGLNAVCRFIDSCARFGPSPFLFSMYGCGEMPQCFCRLCAVFGGLYCLGRQLDRLIQGVSGRIIAVVVAGRRVNCSQVIMAREYVPDRYFIEENEPEKVYRAVYITEKSVQSDEKERVSISSLSCLDAESAIRMLEVGWEVCAAPKGYYVLHLTSRHPIDQDLIEKNLFSKADGPKPLWKLIFTTFPATNTTNLPENVAVVTGADHSPDFDTVIAEAREIFTQFWSDRDFLPRALRREDGEEEEIDEETKDCTVVDDV